GIAVFYRGPRGVTLTKDGKRYLEVATEAFDRIACGISNQPSGRPQLSFSILPSSASLWLQQRLSAFELEHPEIRLTVSTSQRPVNFDQDGVDVALRVGTMPTVQSDEFQPKGDLDMVTSWNGVEAIHVWQEQIVPVCSKHYAESIGGIKGVNDLKRATLIHNESRPNLWSTWLLANGHQEVQPRNELFLG